MSVTLGYQILNAIADLNDPADRSLLIVEDYTQFLERLPTSMQPRCSLVTESSTVSA